MKKRIIPFILLAALVSAGVVLFFMRVYQIPGAASVQRGYIGPAIKTVLRIGALVFIWVVTALAYVITFHRRKPGDDSDAPPVMGNPQGHQRPGSRTAFDGRHGSRLFGRYRLGMDT